MKRVEKIVKNRPTTVRLLDLEEKIKPHLEKTGMKVSELIRVALEHYLELVPELPGDSEKTFEELKKLQVSMAKVGGNLNQLAYHFNVTDEVNESKLGDVHQELRVEFKKVMSFLNKVNYK